MSEKKHPRFAGIGGHQSARSRTDEWLTPPHVIAALGGATSFDLDPCAPIAQPYPTARAVFTIADNGLIRPWAGRIWLCPPYSQKPLRAFMARLAQHGKGTALIFARTETETFWDCVWQRAVALLFLFGRLNFHHVDGTRAAQNAGAPSVLCAYGQGDADVLAYCGLPGAFVPLKIPRGVVVLLAESMTWREAIAQVVRSSSGPVSLEAIYRAMAEHPKARRNQHWKAKIRQQLQQGPFKRAGRGQWRAVAA